MREIERDYSERLTSRSDPATRVIAQRVAEAVLRHFEVAKKPDRAIGPPLGSGDWRADRPDAGPEERSDDRSDKQAERRDSEDPR